MPAKDKITLREYFNTGDVPTEANFTNLIDTIGSITLTVAAYNASDASKGRADYVCDGVNDEVEIQAAIDALTVAGGLVSLSEGTFNIYNAGSVNTDGYESHYGIKIMDTAPSVALHGIPGATVLKQITGGAPDWPHMLLVRGPAASPRTNPTHIFGIEFDANNLATTCIGIQYSGRVTVENCKISGFSWAGIHSFHVSQKTNIHDNYILLHGALYGMALENNYYLISNNIFYDDTSPSTSVLLNLLPDYDILDGEGVRYFDLGASITGNLFMGGNVQLYLSASQACTVMGNVFANQTETGEFSIHVAYSAGVGQDARNNVIVGNTFYNIHNGIILQAAVDTTVALNNFREGPDWALEAGIVESGTNNLIIDNLINSAATPITFAGTGTTVRGNIGWLTENHGAAASTADGGTIDHGLMWGQTPSVALVSGSVAGEIVTVTSLDATHITVAIKKHDGSAGTTQTVYWWAYV